MKGFMSKDIVSSILTFDAITVRSWVRVPPFQPIEEITSLKEPSLLRQLLVKISSLEMVA